MGADPNDLARLSERLTQLMREKMDIRADSFPAALRRAGRRLPPALRREGQVIRIALEQVQHPRLARIADGAGAARAARRIEAYLAQLDPAADRARRRIFLAADVAFRIAVVLALFITVLIWRGLV
jgi:hypothetical protein